MLKTFLPAAEKDAQKEADHSLDARQSISGKGDYSKAITSAAVSEHSFCVHSHISCMHRLYHSNHNITIHA